MNVEFKFNGRKWKRVSYCCRCKAEYDLCRNTEYCCGQKVVTIAVMNE